MVHARRAFVPRVWSRRRQQWRLKLLIVSSERPIEKRVAGIREQVLPWSASRGERSEPEIAPGSTLADMVDGGLQLRQSTWPVEKRERKRGEGKERDAAEVPTSARAAKGTGQLETLDARGQRRR